MTEKLVRDSKYALYSLCCEVAEPTSIDLPPNVKDEGQETWMGRWTTATEYGD
jgi:hypothetical protein